MISSGVVGWKKKDFKTLSFRYVIGDLFSFRNSFCQLGPVFIKKKLKVPAIFTELKSKMPLYFKEHGVRLLFLHTLTIERMASQVFDKFILFC